MEAIEKARKLLEPLAEKYKPRSSICWISYIDDMEHTHTLEDADDCDYCELCIDKAVEEWQKKSNSGQLDVPRGTEITYDVETSPEKEHFCICSMCGEIIFASLILLDDEVWHWETQANFDKLSTQEAYELAEVFGCYGDDKELDPRLEAIAHRVFEEAGKIIGKAKSLLEPTAQNFNPPAMYYAVDYETGEELNTDDQYCVNCIAKAESEYREIHSEITNLQSIEEDHGSQYDGFQICPYCGEVMDVTARPWEQDIEMFETGDYEIDLGDSKSSWLLLKIMNWFGESSLWDLDGRILNLARRLIELNIEKEEKGDVIQQAMSILKPMANKYEETEGEPGAHFLQYLHEGDPQESDIISGYYYCGKCIENARQEFQKKSNNGELFPIPTGAEIVGAEDPSPVGTNFLYCDRCMNVVYLGDLTVDYVREWEDEGISELSPEDAWMLFRMLEEYGYDEEYRIHLTALAQQVAQKDGTPGNIGSGTGCYQKSNKCFTDTGGK